MNKAIAEAVATAPFYADLTPPEVAELAAGMEMRRFAAGEILMAQGAASDGAHLILSGQVSVAARLPGGGESAIADLGAGDMVGEMALLMRGGRRTATARAADETVTLFTDRRYFEASLHLLSPASLKVLRRLCLVTAARLRDVRRLSRNLIDAWPDQALFRPPPAGETWEVADFDVRAFLPILPCLTDFAGEELDALFAAGRPQHVRRGAILAEEGKRADTPRLVVRGALLLGQRREAMIHQLAILGPGRMAGVAPVLEAAPAGSAIIAAEDATLLTFAPGHFLKIWHGADQLTLRLLEAVTADLVVSLNTADNHLTRLTAQVRERELAVSRT